MQNDDDNHALRTSITYILNGNLELALECAAILPLLIRDCVAKLLQDEHCFRCDEMNTVVVIKTCIFEILHSKE